MMPPEVKIKWLAALESGIYTKGKNALNNNGRLCCLGVLCEVMEVPKHRVYDDGSVEYDFNGSSWSGLIPCDFCNIGDSRIVEKLADINDNTETFKEVIEYIKENL